MKACLILVVLFGALIGWMSIHLFLDLLRKKIFPAKQAEIKKMIVQKIRELEIEKGMIDKFNQFDMENEIAPLLEHRLQTLVEQLKHEIPMGEILLSGSLAERLKERARQEIIKGLPEIKERLGQRIQQELALESTIEEVVNQFDIDQVCSGLLSEMKGAITWLKAMGALIGFTVGILEAALLFLIC